MDALSSALGLALPLFKPDAVSLPTASACVDASLACYDLLMFTSQEILFQDRDLACCWDPALASSFHTPSRPPGTGAVRGVVGLSRVGPELEAGAEVGNRQSLKRPDPRGQLPPGGFLVSGIIAAESSQLPASVASGASLAAWAGR